MLSYGNTSPALKDPSMRGDKSLFELVWKQIREDVNQFQHRDCEFPLTAMSRAVAEEIWSCDFSGAILNKVALDVGVGSGCHSLLMAARGFRAILGIDPNLPAIRLARTRMKRLLPRLIPDKPFEGPKFRLFPLSLDQIDNAGDFQYSLTIFNPPAYYDLAQGVHDTPAAQGVYVDDSPSTFLDYKWSFLYRFFNKVVIPRLAPGGHVICTWPGLERRVVERDPFAFEPGDLVHPFDLLEHWFGIEIQSRRRDPLGFFNHTASVSTDYGLGSTFWANLEEGFATGLYSSLADQANDEDGKFGFKFGVLHLTRSSLNASSFEEVKNPS